jgi:hypothetical protein
VPGDFGTETPIIESRVTSEASFSSLQPSVPAGQLEAAIATLGEVLR